MIRGTTPTLKFTIPFDTDLLEEAFVTMVQNDKIIVEKRLSDCTVDKRKLSVRLTQEETLQFPAPAIAQVQLRVLTTDDVALATEPYTVKVKKLLADGVIE